MLLSDQYKEQLVGLHRSRDDFGAGGGKWAHLVHAVAAKHKHFSILDYGCGKAALYKAMQSNPDTRRSETEEWQNYDPAIAEFMELPRPADLVVCTDVLEHIEPDCLQNVLDNLAVLAQEAVLLVIATRPAKKTLPDGRNAHLIQKSLEWWLPLLIRRWHLVEIKGNAAEFCFIGGTR